MAIEESRTDRLLADLQSRRIAANTIAVVLAAYIAPVAVEAYTTIATPDPVRGVASALLFLVLVAGLRAALGTRERLQTDTREKVIMGLTIGLSVLVWLVVWVFPLVATRTGNSLTATAEETAVGELSLLPLFVFVPLWVVYQVCLALGRVWLVSREGQA